MPEIPEGATVPQDHLATLDERASEAIATEEDAELLDGLPELQPPHRLRIRQRNVIMQMAMKLEHLRTEDGGVDLDTDDDPEAMRLLLEITAEVDEFAESIALNRAAYVEWSYTASYEQMTAILTRYASAVGDSAGSAN